MGDDGACQKTRDNRWHVTSELGRNYCADALTWFFNGFTWLIIFGKVKSFVDFLLSATWKPHIKFRILVRHAGNPSSWKTETGRLPRVQGQPGLTVTLSQGTKTVLRVWKQQLRTQVLLQQQARPPCHCCHPFPTVLSHLLLHMTRHNFQSPLYSMLYATYYYNCLFICFKKQDLKRHDCA